VRYTQKQIKRSRTVTEQWEQPFPVVVVETFEPDLEDIDEVLSETE
jgi:hypothetical protein